MDNWTEITAIFIDVEICSSHEINHDRQFYSRKRTIISDLFNSIKYTKPQTVCDPILITICHFQMNPKMLSIPDMTAEERHLNKLFVSSHFYILWQYENNCLEGGRLKTSKGAGKGMPNTW